MNKSEAISTVHSRIRGILEREHGSLTILRIFQEQINQSITNLRQQFQLVKGDSQREIIIWPKMVTGYQPDDQDGVCPIWGPIRDEQGNILGL